MNEHVDDSSCSCYAITPKLIHGNDLNSNQKAFVDALDKGIDNMKPLNEDKMFFRGTSSKYIISRINNGKFVYKSFMSASRRLGEAIRFLDSDTPALLKFAATRGSKVLDISNPEIGSLEIEEVLFGRDLTISIEQMMYDCWTTNMEDEDRLAFSLFFINPKIQFFTISIHH